MCCVHMMILDCRPCYRSPQRDHRAHEPGDLPGGQRCRRGRQGRPAHHPPHPQQPRQPQRVEREGDHHRQDGDPGDHEGYVEHEGCIHREGCLTA